VVHPACGACLCAVSSILLLHDFCCSFGCAVRMRETICTVSEVLEGMHSYFLARMRDAHPHSMLLRQHLIYVSFIELVCPREACHHGADKRRQNYKLLNRSMLWYWYTVVLVCPIRPPVRAGGVPWCTLRVTCTNPTRAARSSWR
jgi:hypothetical protein